MDVGLLIILIFSIFSVILFLFSELVVEIGATKGLKLFNKIFHKNILFYKKKYNMLFASNISIYVNLLSSSVNFLFTIGLFFLYKFQEKIEITNYWKEVYLLIFITSFFVIL